MPRLNEISHMGDGVPHRLKWVTDRFGDISYGLEFRLTTEQRDKVSRLTHTLCGNEISFVVMLDRKTLAVQIELELMSRPDVLVFHMWYEQMKRQHPSVCRFFACGGPESSIPTFQQRWIVSALVPEERCLHLRNRDISDSILEIFS